MTAMTSSKLSLNQETNIKTNSLELNLKRNLIKDITKNLQMDEVNIEIPSLCESMKSDKETCKNSVIISQVTSFYLVNKFSIQKNKCFLRRSKCKKLFQVFSTMFQLMVLNL